MISLDQISKNFPPSVFSQKKPMLREYLQCVILNILFECNLSHKFCFLGGTCIRLIHNSNRFSEDLDFDNFELTDIDFDHVADIIKKGLIDQGFQIEIANVKKGAYRCNIRFPGLLYEQGLSGHVEEKILIQLDTQSQNFKFKSETHILNRFGIYTKLITTSADLLISQKLYAILNRPRVKGRDFYDLVYLLSLGHLPNYEYLSQKLNAGTPQLVKEKIYSFIKNLDFEELTKEVRPFLFNPTDDIRVRYFKEFWEQLKLQ